MNRASCKPESNDSAPDARDNRMGLAPVFAAAGSVTFMVYSLSSQ